MDKLTLLTLNKLVYQTTEDTFYLSAGILSLANIVLALVNGDKPSKKDMSTMISFIDEASRISQEKSNLLQEFNHDKSKADT